MSGDTRTHDARRCGEGAWPHDGEQSVTAPITDRGASLVEYAFLVALIAIVCIVAIGFLGSSTSTQFSQVGNSLVG